MVQPLPDPLVIRAMQQKLDELQQQSPAACERAQRAEMAAALARQQSDEIEGMLAALRSYLDQVQMAQEGGKGR